MDNNKKLPIPAITNYLETYEDKKWKRALVDGWSSEDWKSFGDFVRTILKSSSPVPKSFNSTKEAVDFVRSAGEHSDINSFLYDRQDYREFQQEGFFQPIQCQRCLEDLREQLETDSIPEEEIVDPLIYPVEREYQATSFKLDEEKYVKELGYQCLTHPDIYLMKEESWYE